jgi:hypothetical protein
MRIEAWMAGAAALIGMGAACGGSSGSGGGAGGAAATTTSATGTGTGTSAGGSGATTTSSSSTSSSSTSSSTSSTTGTGTGAVCEALGALVKSKVTALTCPKDNSSDVQTGCAKVLAAFPQCEPKWQAVVTCWGASPDWVCDGSGAASPKPGTCQAEYDALTACNK